MTTETVTPQQIRDEYRRYIAEKTGVPPRTPTELNDLCNGFVRRMRAVVATNQLDVPSRDERVDALAAIADWAVRAIRLEMDLPPDREIGDQRKPDGWRELPEIHLKALDADRKTLHAVAWKLGEALGDVVTELDVDDLNGHLNADDLTDRLIAEVTSLRAERDELRKQLAAAGPATPDGVRLAEAEAERDRLARQLRAILDLAHRAEAVERWIAPEEVYHRVTKDSADEQRRPTEPATASMQPCASCAATASACSWSQNPSDGHGDCCPDCSHDK